MTTRTFYHASRRTLFRGRAERGPKPIMHRAVMATRTRRFISVLLVVLLLDGGAAQASEEISRWCHGNVCYHVFSFNDTAGDTWTTANEQCEVHGLHLTAVWDQDTQDALNAAPPLASTVNAWLAGRRSHNDTFMWLSGQMYETGPILFIGSSDPSGTCGYTQRGRALIQSCSTLFDCLCEREKDPDCPFDEAVLGNKCIWSSSPAATWYNCRNRCRETGGDLASLSDNVAKVLNELTERTGTYHNQVYFWVGLHRRPWHWVSGTGQLSSVYTPMGYYHFEPSNRSSQNNKCLFVNMEAHDRTWADSPCHAKLGAFICDDGLMPVIADETTPSDDQPCGFSLAGVTGMAVAFVVLVAAVISLSACLCRGFPTGSSKDDLHCCIGNR